MSAKIFKYSFTFVLLILFMSFPVSNLIPEASGKDLENIILVEYLVVYMLVATDVIKESMSMISKGLFFEYNHIALICSIILMCLGKYPDGVIALLLYSISRDFGEYLPKGIKKDILSKVDMKAEKVTIKVLETKAVVDINEVEKGTIIEVLPGEMIPLDGRVVKGLGYVDLSSICGESVTMPVSIGDFVKSGAYPVNEKLEIEVVNDIKDSFVSRIKNQVNDSDLNETDMMKDNRNISVMFMFLFTALGFVIAILTPLLSGFKNFDTWIYRGSCIALMTNNVLFLSHIKPGLLNGIYKCLRKGVLVRENTDLVKYAGVRAIVFDIEKARERFAGKAIMIARKIGIDRFAIISDASRDEVVKTGSIIGVDENACYGDMYLGEMLERLNSMNDFSPNVLFIGDQKTDNVMLKRATVGGASGMAESYEDYNEYSSAGVVAFKDSPEPLVDNILTANDAVRIIRSNVTIAYAFKLIVIIGIILGFVPISVAMCAEVILMIILMMRVTS